MIKIALISEDNLVNYSLKHLVDQQPRFKISHVLPTLDEARIKPLLAKRQVNLIIISVSLPKTDGLELLAQLRVIAPRVPILILSNNEEDEFLANFIRSGCKGCLDRHASVEDLLSAIEEISAGRYVIPAKLQAALNAHEQPLPHERLSNREFQVFLKFIQRKPISTVARELNVTTGAVSVFRSRVLKKLNFKSNADFIFYALQHHLLVLPASLPH